MKKKSRIIVRKGKENIALKTEDVVIFYRDEALTVAMDNEEKKYLCEGNLTLLQEELDEGMFFRANRKYIVNIQYVKGFAPIDRVKLEVFLSLPLRGHQIIVSQETAPHFKKWVAGEP